MRWCIEHNIPTVRSSVSSVLPFLRFVRSSDSSDSSDPSDTCLARLDGDEPREQPDEAIFSHTRPLLPGMPEQKTLVARHRGYPAEAGAADRSAAAPSGRGNPLPGGGARGRLLPRQNAGGCSLRNYPARATGPPGPHPPGANGLGRLSHERSSGRDGPRRLPDRNRAAEKRPTAAPANVDDEPKPPFFA